MKIGRGRRRNRHNTNIPGWGVQWKHGALDAVTPWFLVRVFRWIRSVEIFWAANLERKDGEPLFLRSVKF